MNYLHHSDVELTMNVLFISERNKHQMKKQKGKAQLMAKVWEASWNSSLVAPTDFY